MKRLLLGLFALMALMAPAEAQWFKYNAAVPAYSVDGQFVYPFVSADGVQGSQIVPSAVAVLGLTPVVSAAVETGHVLKATAGNLYGLEVVSGASAGFVLLFNATSIPGDGAVTPVKCYTIAANSTIGINFTPTPEAFTTGITAVFSTTGCFTKTASATAYISGDIK